MNLPEISIKNPVFAWMLMIGLMLFGGLAFRNMGVSQLPDVDYPYVNISVSLDGAAPEVVEMDIVEPIESGLTAIAGIKSIASSARAGSARVSVEFEINKDIDVAIQEVQAKLGQIQRQLPKDIDSPIVSKSNPEDSPIMWLGVSSEKMTRTELMRYVRDHVQDYFKTLPGVSDIFLGGYIDPVLQVSLSAQKLNRYALSANDVVSTIQGEHIELPSGRLQVETKEYNLRTLGEAAQPEDFAKIPIAKRGGSPNYAPIPISAVGSVVNGLDEVRRLSRVNGNESVGLGIRKQRGVNSVSVAQGIRDKLVEIQASLPEGTYISVNFDSTKFIEESIHELIFNIILSALLTAAACWLFLGSWSSTINVILAIPTSIIGCFIVLNYLNFTLNMFTLLALSLSIGIVVDDAIMVLENIVRHYEHSKNRVKSALLGSKEIMFAALAATAAIIAIFLPVAFMDGLIGQYFYQFGVTISVTVAISLLEALTLTPMRCAAFLSTSERSTRFGRAVEESFNYLARGYQNLLPYLIKYRWPVIIASIILFTASLGLITQIRREFSPEQDQSLLMVRSRTPVGSNLQFTNDRMKIVESIITKQPEVERYFSNVGGFSGEVNTGMVFVTLKPLKERGVRDGQNAPLSQQDIADILRKELRQVPDTNSFVSSPSTGALGGGRGYPVEFSIRGPEWDQLIKSTEELKEAMEGMSFLTDAESGYRGDGQEYHIIPNRNAALRHGVSISDLAQTVNILLGGITAGKFSHGGKRYDIKVRLTDNERVKPEDVLKLNVRNNRGELIPLSLIAEIKPAVSMQTISRYDGERAISVYANLAKGANQAAAMAQVKATADKILPPGYRAIPAGNSQTFNETFSSLIFALLLGVVVSYMVLASQFNSFIDPITVLIALPFSLTGALVALYATNHSLNMYSMIGIILLMGLVKKNSILLVDFTNQKRAEGLNVKNAIITACPMRLRAILMTSFATIAAAIPPALALGPGAEAYVPLAISIIGGAGVSTILTLFVVPCVYSLFARRIRSVEADLA